MRTVTPVRRLASAAAHLAAAAAALSIASLSGGVANADMGNTSCFGEATPTGILHTREFSAQDTGQGTFLFTVEGLASMSQSDAQKFVDGPGRPEFFLMTDDEVEDDTLNISVFDYTAATPEGFYFRAARQLPYEAVNEDKIPGQDDEIYARVQMYDVRYNGTHKVETCRLHFAL
jgi:hypothetical protein